MKDARLEEARLKALHRYRRIKEARWNLDDAGDGSPSVAEVKKTLQALEGEALAVFERLDLQSLEEVR